MELRRVGSSEQLEWKGTFKEGKERSMPKRGKKAKTKNEGVEERRVRVSSDGRVAIVTLDHPPANILDFTTLGELDEALRQSLRSDEFGAVIIAGKGNAAFVGGRDMDELLRLEDSDAAREFAAAGQKILGGIEQAQKPIIAAIGGLCLGAGLELAAACHLRIASENSFFGFPDIKLSLIPHWGSTRRLPRLIGMAKALELILTGRVIDAQEAREIGLVSDVVPDGEALSAALALAKEIASYESSAVIAALRAVERSSRVSSSKASTEEADAFAALVVSEEARRAIRAAQARRRPEDSENEW
jgi:enoyl-CoA hydratase/carnithine racemase